MSAPSVAVEVVLPERTSKITFKEDVAPWEPQLAKVCARGFTPERVISGALHAGLTNPQIFDCDPRSIFLALAKVARLGLDVGEGIDLIPLNNTVKRKVAGEWVERQVLMLEAWIGYHGLKALGMRQGLIRSMEEFPVYEGDRFDFELGLNRFLRHKPCATKDRGKLTGAYSIIRLRGGIETFHYMPIEDVERIRASSRQWGPRKVPICPEWYAMKTVVRDYLGRQPQTGAMSEALESDDVARLSVDLGDAPEALPPAAPQSQPKQPAATERTDQPATEDITPGDLRSMLK